MAADPRANAVHQSTIKSVLDICSWKFYLESIVGLPKGTGWDALVGTSVHHAIEQHERARIAARHAGRAPDLPSLHAMQLEAGQWLVDNDIGPTHDYGDGRPACVESAQGAADACLAHWWNGTIPVGQPGGGGTLRDRVMGWTPVAVEPYFRVWTGLDQPLGGWIDGVYLKPDGQYVLVDNKTAKNYGRWPTDGSVDRTQPAMYSSAVVKATNMPMWGDMPSFEFHIMRTMPGSNSRFEGVRVIEVQCDDLDVEWIDLRARQTLDVINSGSFEPCTDTPLCAPRWCSFWGAEGSPCPARPEGYSE